MIKTIKKAGIIFSFATVLIGSSAVMAQLCVKSDCDALGYTSTAAACKNHFNTLLCPFDNTKALCGGEVKPAGSGVSMFYFEGKLYSAISANIGGIDYNTAANGCAAKGYRLPVGSEAYRVSALRSQLNFTLRIDTHGNTGSEGIWVSNTCSGGHQVAYLDGYKCKADTFRTTATLCVKEH